MDAQTSPQEVTETPLQYNVTGTRIVAALIDMVVIGAVFVIMLLGFGETTTTTGPNGGFQNEYKLTGMPFVVFLLASFAYFLVFEGLFGATLGKVVMGLRVVDIDGSRCEWPAAFIRNILRLIDALPILYLVGFIAVAVNEKKQRPGDLAAQTLVVRGAMTLTPGPTPLG